MKMPNEAQNESLAEKAIVNYEFKNLPKEYAVFIVTNIPYSAFTANRVKISDEFKAGKEAGDLNFVLTPSESTYYNEAHKKSYQQLRRFICQKRGINYTENFNITLDELRAYLQALDDGLLDSDLTWNEYLESYFNEANPMSADEFGRNEFEQFYENYTDDPEQLAKTKGQ